MSVPTLNFCGYRVYELRGGSSRRLHAAADSYQAQEREMTRLVGLFPDALLVYRTRQSDGSWKQELHLDRTLAELPKPWQRLV